MTLLWVSNIILWVVVVILAMILFALVRKSNQMGSMQPEEVFPKGEAAPDFTGEMLDGQEISLSDFSGEELFLVFVSPTCGPCKEKIIELEKDRRSIEKSVLNFFYVVRGEKDAVPAFVEEYGIASQAIYADDNANSFFKDYMVTFTPSCCLIDAEGIVQYAGFLKEYGDDIYESLTSGDGPKSAKSRSDCCG